MNCLSFEELDIYTLYEILALRAKVFVVEQDCNYLDPDTRDFQSYHVFDRKDQKIVSYARLYQTSKGSHIGRVLTSKSVRRKGFGISLMKYCIEQCKVLYGTTDIIISAQEYLLDFYASFGFKVEGERYYEDNLPHFTMRLKF